MRGGLGVIGPPGGFDTLDVRIRQSLVRKTRRARVRALRASPVTTFMSDSNWRRGSSARSTPPARPARRGARSGYSLIELVVVLALIAIATAFAWPRVNSTQYRMDAAVRVTRMTLQNAQRLAITRQFDVVVGFDLANNRMRVLEDNNNNQAADAGERVVYRSLEEGAVFQAPGVTIGCATAAAVCGTALRTIDGLESVIFRRNGAASTDVEVYLNSVRGGTDDGRGVTVIQSTGRTDWYKYVGGAWKQGSL